jgi:hypothetical protein
MTDELKKALEAADRENLVAAVEYLYECHIKTQNCNSYVCPEPVPTLCKNCGYHFPTITLNILKGKSDGKV